MEDEEATQPATQIVMDPRRLGQVSDSGLNNEDLADIICILHPASNPAEVAAHEIHKATPHYTVNVDTEWNTNGGVHNGDRNSDVEDLVKCDIVLRLSANLKDPVGGYHFGRNAQRCDYVIGAIQESRRVSNTHFKVYINEHGIVMVEDQSTNGTAVDGTLLRGKDKENGRNYRHTLENGSIITLTMTPPEEDYRFIVRFPQRDQASEDAYQKNLAAFFVRIDAARQEHDIHALAPGAKGKSEPVNLFPTPRTGTPNLSNMSAAGRPVREWRGGQKYNKIGCIGKGAFAVVYKITTKLDGIPYAAKELEKRRFMKNGVLDQKVDNEMKIMSRIKHPNVVQYIEHVDWEEYLYIIMEFVPGGDLASLMREYEHLPEPDVKTMATQLLSALRYLHGMNITHRDVKPDNILIHTREPFHVKLTDFGLSKMIDSDETFLRTFCGTLLYCAPEVYSEYREYDHTGRRNYRGLDKKSLPPQRYGHAVDIWSLAGVLFFALCGSPPYPVKNGTSYQELLNQIMTHPLDIRPLQRVNISEHGIRFVRKMLHTSPEHRASVEELEKSAWITGVSDLDVSMDDDEVDVIADGFIDPELEQGASQLSINQPQDSAFGDSEEMENVSDLTEIQQRLEIPSSFISNDSLLNGEESYGFMHNNYGARNGRLFGEVNASDLGSSGAIPHQLNLPLPTTSTNETRSSLDSSYTHSESGQEAFKRQNTLQEQPFDLVSTIPATMQPAPNTHMRVEVFRHRDTLPDDRPFRSSSLMGAESMVGHLNMHSPSSVESPTGESLAPSIEDTRAAAISLRRRREDEEPYDLGEGTWRPVDMPPKRRRTSAREIDIRMPASVFWDPGDKSTHHSNYPPMTTFDWSDYKAYAKSKGEEFTNGHRTFDNTMQSFRSSRSPSLEPETARARSEPAKDDGRRNLMKRDERKLGSELNGQSDGSGHKHLAAQDALLPPTAHPSYAPSASESGKDPQTGTYPSSQPVVGHDFQPPKRILAKVVATYDSCLPTISLNITDIATSWGRGMHNTLRHANGLETRIPKYAFKIVLFKPGFSAGGGASANNARAWTVQDQDMTFYIATKSSVAIWVNDSLLPSFNPRSPEMECKFWGELYHGDLITVWVNDKDNKEYTSFRFECLWGKSKAKREAGNEFKTLKEGDLTAELDRECISQEKEILAEQAKRYEAEMNAMQKNQESIKLAEMAPPKFTQSFAPARPSSS